MPFERRPSPIAGLGTAVVLLAIADYTMLVTYALGVNVQVPLDIRPPAFVNV